MRTSTRLTTAYIAARLITGKDAGSVYDYSASRHISISGEVTSSRVNVYNHDVGKHFSGDFNGDKFSFISPVASITPTSSSKVATASTRPTPTGCPCWRGLRILTAAEVHHRTCGHRQEEEQRGRPEGDRAGAPGVRASPGFLARPAAWGTQGRHRPR